ncbi:MAG: aminotransferase class IV family protein [Chloroflexi bacterium]|nr:aminotransferase class IV family protein [Chloroflexota bacterium]
MSASSHIWLNGRLVLAAEARVSAFDHGLLYGHGVFETMRVYRGRVFRLRSHLDRLADGARILEISLPPHDTLERAVASVLEANRLSDARIRLTVTAGEGPARPIVPAPGPPTILITWSPLATLDTTAWERGYRLCLASTRRHSASPLARIKATNYLENLLAHAEAVRQSADDAILLNERDDVTECCLSNLFIVRDKRVVTPSLDCGLLPGITRAAVLEVAAECRVNASEERVTMKQLVAADEVFVTNSIVEVEPVTAIDGKRIGDGTPGPVTRQMANEYQRLVARELGLSDG